MSDTPTTGKSFFSSSIVQTFLTFLSPIAIAIVGFILDSSVTDARDQVELTRVKIDSIRTDVNNMKTKVDAMKVEMETKIAPVEAMKPFMEMLSETDQTKNIMGAYGIYMLKSGADSRIAAQMISATQKEHLLAVLTDLAENDSLVRNWINRFKDNSANITSDELSLLDEDSDKIKNLSKYQQYLLKLTGELERSELVSQGNKPLDMSESNEAKPEGNGVKKNPDGWIYLGQGNGLIVERQERDMILAPKLDWPAIRNKAFTVKTAINMRVDKPRAPSYRNQKLLRVLQEGSSFKIDTFTVDKKRNVWARIFVEE